jgi:nicotinate-nucleotide adenylyltransferase
VNAPRPVPPADAAPLIIFGGSFDPPHAGHAHIARHALRAAGPLAWMIFVPAARSPFKRDAPAASDDARVAMLRLMLEHEPRCSVWTDELERTAKGHASYTIETTERLGLLFPGRPIRLLMGADQAVALHRWRDATRLLVLAAPMIACRDDAATTREELAASLRNSGAWTDSQLERLASACFACPLIEASSTRIRASPTGAGTLLHPAVSRYIEEHGLYGA